MTVSAQTQGDTGLVTLAGRFTFESHKAFKGATEPLLLAPEIRQIHVDMAGLEFMDASSLGMLLVLREKAELKSKTVLLLRPTPSAVELLESVQFGRLFRISK